MAISCRVTLPRVVCLSLAVGSDPRPTGDHRPQGLRHEQRKRHVHYEEADDHCHPANAAPARSESPPSNETKPENCTGFQMASPVTTCAMPARMTMM